MKTRLVRSFILAAAVAMIGCTTAQIQQAGTTVAPLVGNLAQIAVDSYIANGSVNSKQLASNALNGVAAIAQGYIGKPVTVAPLAAGAGLDAQAQATGKAIVSAIPVGTITQDLVNQLFVQAAKAGK